MDFRPLPGGRKVPDRLINSDLEVNSSTPAPANPLLIMDFRPHPGAGRVPDRLINSTWG